MWLGDTDLRSQAATRRSTASASSPRKQEDDIFFGCGGTEGWTRGEAERCGTSANASSAPNLFLGSEAKIK